MIPLKWFALYIPDYLYITGYDCLDGIQDYPAVDALVETFWLIDISD